jgi:hypothetical protein
MEKNRLAVLRLTKELHEMRDEIEEDLDLLVDKDIIEEMRKMGLFEA